MTTSIAKPARLALVIFLLFSNYVTSLIIPEDLPTVTNVFFSVFPPIKIGTDSRIGIGFKFGEHADFQVLTEYGPQKYTQQIGNVKDKKSKRDTMMAAALKGEFGPWSQVIAKIQMRRKYKKLLEEYKIKAQKSNNLTKV
ncbi:uncharacterized protein LOC106639993 [Copidosoma floridanum]|uniref:uncharacterized protein LOC106639993 n=1 Tax=Copidosoma floridanum TaxID=29053 RepID=UPI0006C9E0E7|nr:uncharacterized protein LOC106639993 [Copidosoma floridanum]XP_014209327.1 uncharacterized protein LOC106639993 [Copidosoma floridanum]